MYMYNTRLAIHACTCVHHIVHVLRMNIHSTLCIIVMYMCTCTRYILSLSFDQFTLYKYVVLYAMYMYVSFLHSRYTLYIDSLWLQYEEQTGESGQSYRYYVCACTIYCVYIGLCIYMYMCTIHVRIPACTVHVIILAQA